MSLFPILQSHVLLQRHCHLIRRGLTSTPTLKTAPSKYIIGGVPQDYNSEEAEDNSPGISNRYFGPKSNFVDFKHIQVVGGRGGDGAVSFLRDKITSDGPPNGGNGGNGGNKLF
ncbi:GTPase of the mitochondrial inner membrane that associates with the large ribosomal subunit [Entomophthora muscae]|uniref:GTPase of the mitochondrial inner membrane that associates with the large ribosomal subunit n=1 Tax=Entomophthora muscae TaxID=34485 RepID=A0ACC2RX27_9FUNG|nr:GTPase of the mitochondrial inner membrane that associates with the large ribosomal subunit [Entomophthora muscae]